MIDNNIALYARKINDAVQYLDKDTRRASLIEIRTYCEAITRVINFDLNRKNNGSGVIINIDESIITTAHDANNDSLTAQLSAQMPEITAQSHIIGSCLVCGASLQGKRKGAVCCCKKCTNSNRKKK